jgi:hypothetical protein
MATLERSRDGGERVDLDDRLGAGAPSAFPVDELVALRNRSGSQEEAGSGPVERRSELREVGEPSTHRPLPCPLEGARRLTRSRRFPLTATAALGPDP